MSNQGSETRSRDGGLCGSAGRGFGSGVAGGARTDSDYISPGQDKHARGATSTDNDNGYVTNPADQDRGPTIGEQVKETGETVADTVAGDPGRVNWSGTEGQILDFAQNCLGSE
ncbi:hypothetical protein FS749_012239 [Ceratobasidium sp. UAMH 11750]|nr:hypothetical protein FS749_012239 [Ceratobasidium sp. UAMH 11750]